MVAPRTRARVTARISPQGLRSWFQSSRTIEEDLQRRAQAVEARAYAICPVDDGIPEGHLRDTIFSRPDPTVGRFNQRSWIVGASSRYALFVHEGYSPTGPRPPQRFLTNALPAGGGTTTYRGLRRVGGSLGV
jgi:hypothetical protein